MWEIAWKKLVKSTGRLGQSQSNKSVLREYKIRWDGKAMSRVSAILQAIPMTG